MKYLIILFVLILFGCGSNFQTKYQGLDSQVDVLLIKSDYLILEARFLIEKNECSK